MISAALLEIVVVLTRMKARRGQVSYFLQVYLSRPIQTDPHEVGNPLGAGRSEINEITGGKDQRLV